MPDEDWRPRFRMHKATVTKVLASPAFLNSRERTSELIDDPAGLRRLASFVERIEAGNQALDVIADRVAASVRLLRARAAWLDTSAGPAGGIESAGPPYTMAETPGGQARERLLVAALHYLVTPIDLVPDFRPGGYLDDVLLLSWVFGAAANELEPYATADLEP
jgi:Protein of unknown function (DUF1232)